MKENALVLNEADKTLMYLVGCDEGEDNLSRDLQY